MSIQQVLFASGIPPAGQQSYTSAGSFTWTAPAGVTSVCVICVGAGGGVGLLGEGTNGDGASTYDGQGSQAYGHCGKGGSGGAPQTFAAFPGLGPGSGGGGGNGIAGSNGAVRIIWGSGRSFPSTNTANA